MPFIVPFIPAIASAVGAIAKGRASGRQAEAGANAQQDQLRQAADQTGLQAANHNAQLPGLRANNAVRGDILSGLQSVGESGSGRDLHFTGGLSPALLSQNTRNYGQTMNAAATGNNMPGADVHRQALLDQLGGGYQAFKPQFTAPTPLPQAGALDHILQGVGMAGGALDIYNQTKGPK